MNDGSSRPYFMVTERLGFGIWTNGDIALAMAIWGDPVVTRLTGGPFDGAQVRDRMALEMANRRAHGLQYWPIFRLDTGEHVGCCGLRPRNGSSRISELGFQLRGAAWGQGYASEAARAVISWSAAHEIIGLIAGHHPENLASMRVLQRLGFTYTHDELYPPTGRMEPCYLLSIERSVAGGA